MWRIKQSEPQAVRRRVYFTCVDTTSVLTRLKASDMSTFTVYLSVNGATPTLTGYTPAEVGATNAPGLFYAEFLAADIANVGVNVLDITNAGGTKVMERREIVVAIDPAFYFSIVSGSLSPTAFSTNLTQITDDYWKDTFVLAVTGSLAGQVHRVGAYNGSTKVVTLVSGSSFTGTPTAGDVFEFINR